MAVQIQLRNDTAANWTSENPILAIGEFGLETDTGLFKIGDGATVWASLAYGGVQGEQGVIAATAPLAYDSGTQTVSIDLSSYDTSSEVDTKIANLVDSAPATLDTLNELAAALGDDANFATTVTNSLANKADLHPGQIVLTSATDVIPDHQGTTLRCSGTFTLTIIGVFQAGSRVDVVNNGTGVITFAAGGSNTLNSKDGAVTLDTQYAAATIYFANSTSAILIGDIA